MHRNAPLTPQGRLRLCQMIEEGWTIASSAESMRISRQTAHKWWGRYLESGVAGLEDRSSRPRRCPTKTPPKVERRLVELRRRHQLGPARLAPRAGVPASTLHRVLQRHGVSRLSDLDRHRGRVIRRIETTQPGELVHIDIKKQARIPKGGGWRVAAELLNDVIKHTFTKPYKPQTNGKVERFNRTLLNEWAYARPYRSESARTRALDTWLHLYNHHRHHTAIGGPPISRVNNLVGQNS
jgi:transposase InsO family protein